MYITTNKPLYWKSKIRVWDWDTTLLRRHLEGVCYSFIDNRHYNNFITVPSTLPDVKADRVICNPSIRWWLHPHVQFVMKCATHKIVEGKKWQTVNNAGSVVFIAGTVLWTNFSLGNQQLPRLLKIHLKRRPMPLPDNEFHCLSLLSL